MKKKKDKSFLLDTLNKSKKNKEIIGIWQYNDSDGFIAGYVLDVNSTFFTFQHLTKYGKLDGIVFDKIESIQSVDFNDEYSKALQYVFDNSEKLEIEENFEIKLSEKEEWQSDTIKQFEGENIVISLEISGDEFYTGFVKKVSETDFILHCIGKMGEDEGTVIYKIEDITALKINDLDNRKRKMLFKWRKASL